MGEIVRRTSSKGVLEQYVMLSKDGKPICRTLCHNPPAEVPSCWSLAEMVRRTKLPFLAGLPQCTLIPAAESDRDEKEWGIFLSYLKTQNKVAVVKFDLFEFYILPPVDANLINATVAYRTVKSHDIHHDPNPSQPEVYVKDGFVEKNYARADPSYLKTLGHTHSGWIFGAVAELVDNSRDAKATKLDISVEMIYFKKSGKSIPVLSVIDDGHGMTHHDIVIMASMGHKQPKDDETERIGRFGVGFKTGAMRLGRDALVITQTAYSRSIAFLSQSFNEGRDNLEIPIVSYRRQGQVMEVDTGVQSETLAKYNLKAIKDFSPFNKYLIGEKAGLFRESTGTQIYIWNLDEWGSNYSLEWQRGSIDGSSFHQGDIYIRSRRIRSRPGQISQKVPLDYSLRSYLEVIFLVPRMKIYVQGSMMKSQPLEKFLNKTLVETGRIMGKRVQLTLGRSQLEWEQANCGMFLYWHGRLIENDGKGGVWVLNNKQGFQDSEIYAHLEKWLGRKADEYWDKNFDGLQLTKRNFLYKPDNEWVQCDKCRKWRMLSPGFDTKTLPLEWFCYMAPFYGRCEIPEEKVESGLITLSAKRSGDSDSVPTESEGDEDDYDPNTEEVKSLHLKRKRKRLARTCKRGRRS